MHLALVACVICEACAKVNSHWLLVEREGRQPPSGGRPGGASHLTSGVKQGDYSIIALGDYSIIALVL